MKFSFIGPSLAIAVLTFTLLISAPQPGWAEFEANAFQLVNLAYEGYLEAQGIPSRGTLEDRYNHHDIDAEDLIAAGILAGYLPESRREDTAFRNAVRTQMQSLRDDRYRVYDLGGDWWP
jgi:hypothetical protein